MSLSFQSSYSRSNYHWTFTRTATGRMAMVADGKGVPLLIGTTLKILSKNPSISKTELVELLHKQTGNRSLEKGDLSQVFKQMFKARILKMNGSGRDATYQLTPKGAETWKRIAKDLNWR